MDLLIFGMNFAVSTIFAAFTISANAVGQVAETSNENDSVGPLKLRKAWKFIQYEGSQDTISNLIKSGQYEAGASVPIDIQGKIIDIF